MIELSESDIFGNLTLTVNSEEEFKDQYYAKRPNVILEKVFLNGVCRHEQRLFLQFVKSLLLNGVCRHEQENK